MKFDQCFNEDVTGGSISAGGIAGVRGSLFSEPVRHTIPGIQPFSKKKRKSFKKLGTTKLKFLKKILSDSKWITERIDPTNVLAMLSKARKEFDFGKDTVSFGLDDENGNTVRVYVKADQAVEFEHEIADILSDEPEKVPDIAELLYGLRSKYTITHIDWGSVEEDEEPTNDKTDSNSEEKPESGVENSSDEGQDEIEDTVPLNNSSSSSELTTDAGQQSALDKVIGMLKADADARTAESNAREAEARAKEAEYTARAAELKIRGEEEVLDMEAFNKKQTEDKKEAVKLAKIAKYRHQLADQLKDESKDTFNAADDIKNIPNNKKDSENDENEDDFLSGPGSVLR